MRRKQSAASRLSVTVISEGQRFSTSRVTSRDTFRAPTIRSSMKSLFWLDAVSCCAAAAVIAAIRARYRTTVIDASTWTSTLGTGDLAWMGTLVADYRDNFSLAMARSSSVNSPFHSGVRSRASTERSSLPCSFRKMNPVSGMGARSELPGRHRRNACSGARIIGKNALPNSRGRPTYSKALQRGFEFFVAGHWATQIDFTTQPAFREVARTGPAPACGILTSRLPPVNRRHASLPAPAPNPETPEPPAAATHPPHPPPPSPLGAPSPWLG